MTGCGFLPAARGGGGSFAPDGTLPQYDTMSALDAGLTVVGRVAELIGATTGERIALVERRSAGANGLAWHGDLALDQADGTELDGAWAPVSLGSAGPVTWGGAGSRGMILPAGTITLPGWRYVLGTRQGVAARIEGWTAPVAPAQHDMLAVGFIRNTSGVVAIAGGFGYNSAPARRSAYVSGGTLDLPTGTYSATAEAGLSDGATIWPSIQIDPTTSSGAGRYSAGIWGTGMTSTGGITSSSVASHNTNATDLQVALIRRGDWGATARVTRIVAGGRLP